METFLKALENYPDMFLGLAIAICLIIALIKYKD